MSLYFYFKNRNVLQNRALPLGKRLRAWRDSPASVASYNAETWHVSAHSLADLRTWELKMLRRMLKLRRRPEEGYMQYNQRTAACIHKWCSRSNVVLLYARVVKAVYKAAWTDNAFTLDSGASPLKSVRQYRSAEWWQTHVFITTQAKRRKLGTNHR